MRTTVSMVISLTVALAGSCQLDTRYFNDYAGKNLLADFGFEKTDTASAPYWKSLTAAASVDNYLTFESAGTAGQDGLSPAYRLETKNLFPNGDFEAALNTTTLWTSQNLQNPLSVTVRRFSQNSDLTALAGYSTALKAISGNSVYLDAADPLDQFLFDLKNALGTAYTAGRYQMRLQFRTIGNLTAHYYESSGGLFPRQQAWAVGVDPIMGNAEPGNQYNTIADLPNPTDKGTVQEFEISNTSNTHILSFGINAAAANPFPPNKQTIVFDNLRLVRTDDGIDPFIQLRLPKLTSPGLQLLPGIYEFSFYVKDDPSAGSGNRFTAAAMTLQVKAYTKTNTSEQVVQTLINRPSTGWAAWTLVTVRIPKIDFADIDPPAASGLPVLVVRIAAGNKINGPSAFDAGSVLICQPRLEFFER